MKLFFETITQSRIFLLSVLLGFILCFLLDVRIRISGIRFVLDLLTLFCSGVCLVMGLLLSGEHRVRLYHILGILCGSLLYLEGFSKTVRIFRRWGLKRKEGIGSCHGEETNNQSLEKG